MQQKPKGDNSVAQFSHNAAVTRLKYCRHGVKLYPISQTVINHKTCELVQFANCGNVIHVDLNERFAITGVTRTIMVCAN